MKFAFDASWNESDHPRDGGKFASASGSGSKHGQYKKGSGSSPTNLQDKPAREKYNEEHLRTVPVDDLEKNAKHHVDNMHPRVRKQFSDFVKKSKARAKANGENVDHKPDHEFLSNYVENLH